MNSKWFYLIIFIHLTMVFAVSCKKDPIHIGLAKYNNAPSNNFLEERIVSIVRKQHPEAEFELKDAGGNTENARQIAAEFAQNSELVLRLAIDTPIAQSFAEESGSPIIYAAVTDPESAGILSSNSPITGYSDAVPVGTAIQKIQALMPELDSLGQIESVEEASSRYITGLIRYRANLAGISLVRASILYNTDQISDAVSTLASDQVGVLYLANSSLLFENIETVMRVANRNLLPVVSSDPLSARGSGVLLAYGANYEKMAQAVADLVIQYLAAQNDEQKAALFTDTVHLLEGEDATQIYFDPQAAESLGLEPPAELLSESGNSETAETAPAEN